MPDLRRRPRLLLTVLIAVSVVLIGLDLRGAVVSNGLRAVIGTVVAPVQKVAAAVAFPIRRQIAGMGEYADRQDAQAEVDDAIGRPAEEPSGEAASADAGTDAPRVQLSGPAWTVPLAALRRAGQTLVAARVTVASGAESASTTLAIDVGSADGVAVDQAVLAPQGLVGRVVRVGRDYAVVELVSSPGISVGARLGTSEQLGIVQGQGLPNVTDFQPLDSSVDLPAGEPVLTAGSPGSVPYPPGVMIGRLGASNGPVGQPGRNATVEISAGLTSLTVVAVVVPEGRS